MSKSCYVYEAEMSGEVYEPKGMLFRNKSDAARQVEQWKEEEMMRLFNIALKGTTSLEEHSTRCVFLEDEALERLNEYLVAKHRPRMSKKHTAVARIYGIR